MTMDEKYTQRTIPQKSTEQLFKSIEQLLATSRNTVKKSVDTVMVYTYFEMGKMIVEEEQNGQDRAAYGTQLINELSVYLTEKFGKGFSIGNLKNIRQFYRVYIEDQIGETVFSQSEMLPTCSSGRKFYLSWSHYLVLMRIKNVDERHFYEIEAAKNDWSLSELKRQFNSSLYERLLLGNDKNRVMQLAQQGQLIETTADAVKDPYILEFLGLDEKSVYSENDLENRILDNLQKFLLELGKGYTFVARQKRFTFDEEHYRVDLVFYNRLLQCFVLIDLKIGELKHQDLGQMQMYVNYYDRYEKQEFENPTIGILLCKEKNDAMVELTLPKDSNIFASKYELYLPDKKLLQEKLQEWVTEEGGVTGNEATI
jgi:predicted nuclease of restriction endonuclease-like (RecB) superfamily